MEQVVRLAWFLRGAHLPHGTEGSLAKTMTKGLTVGYKLRILLNYLDAKTSYI
jgi:ribosomal protein L6P/L9E